jgi:hypothetical protein
MKRKAEDELLDTLLTEMAQTERSAVEHPRKEAARFAGGAPPVLALLAVADHAERALVEIERFPDGSSGLGEAIGRTFSAVRDAVADRLVSREKSYRGTLLGLQHGVDCALLVRAVADAGGRADVVAFLDRWLAERQPLVAACRGALEWFAHNPDLALERAS